MGEIIDKPVPDRALEFTGERLTSSFGGQTAIEHWHRYLLARELVRGRDVLDVACGEGYGSALLSQTAKSVVGVDVSADTVKHARESYVSANLQYLEGDACQIPVPDNSVDAVVSFETLEHFTQQEQFLLEIRRVLRPGGLLLISTPDRDLYSPAAETPNPHHRLELTTAEFLAILQKHFPNVRCQGQRILLGSALFGAEGSAQPPFCFERRGATHFETSVGMARPRYLLALASDSPDHALPDSVYVDTDHLSFFDGPTLDRYIAEAPSLADTKSALAAAEQQVVALQLDKDRLEREVAEIFRSTSWKVSAPLRKVVRLLRSQ